MCVCVSEGGWNDVGIEAKSGGIEERWSRLSHSSVCVCACVRLGGDEPIDRAAVRQVMMHYFYVTAFTKHKQFLLTVPSVMTVGIAAYWMLMFLWLKFLILWRFARFFALVDGTHNPPLAM